LSGIAGLFRRDGLPLDLPTLARMGEALAHRGPDAAGSWSEGAAGLVHRALLTTPDSLGETQPVVLEGGTLVGVADARLDNREALLESLGLENRSDPPLGDAELLLRAYRRWGEACLEHLLGDFAFAVWDRERRRLFCARDPFGVRPLYYHDSERLFSFGSEIKALLSIEGVPRRLNLLRVAYFLEIATEDEAPTFYEGIHRLPAGHALLADSKGARSHRYFELHPTRRLPAASDGEYLDRYREIFVDSVGSRLRSAFPVGSFLSGGLDSSTVVCVARDLLAASNRGPLRTFSVVFEDVPESDERPFIEAVLAGGGVLPQFIRGDRLDPFEDWDRFLWHQDEACYGANLFLNRAVYRSAREQDVRILLDGLDGDSVVGYGLERLAALARRGRWIELGKEILLLSKRLGRPPRMLLRRYVVRPLLQGLRTKAPRSLRTAWRGLRPSRGRNRRRILHPDLARRLDVDERIRSFRESIRVRTAKANAPQQSVAFLSGLIPAGLEVLDRLAAGYRLRPAYPFLDRRMVEFCLALPSELKLRRGWTRYIERVAFSSLPDQVRWRGWKGTLGPNFSQALRRSIEGGRAAGESWDVVSDLVDLPVFRRIYERFRTGPGTQEAFEVSMVLGLIFWLRASGVRG